MFCQAQALATTPNHVCICFIRDSHMKRTLNFSPGPSHSFRYSQMRNSIRTLFVFFTIIILHEYVMCSAISFQQDLGRLKRSPSPSRRLLAAETSFPVNDLNKVRAGFKETVTSAEASLRKRPPSSSNPTQN